MKKKIIIILSFIIVVIGLLSLYRTFAINKNNDNADNIDSDINLSYSLKNPDMNVIANTNEEKYVDINLSNIYNENVKYGIYYKMNEPQNIPDGLNITIDELSKSNNAEILKPHEKKTITIKIVNSSEYNVSITLGSVIGFVSGDINTLLNDDMILIK